MIDEAAKLFLQYNFLETKDLCKHFITIIIGVLVFSLTFSEKIVDFKNTGKTAKGLLLICWGFLIFSIIFCGLGLCYISLAGGQAVYGGNYNLTAGVSYNCIILSGLCFIFGLLFMIIAAVVSIFNKNNLNQQKLKE